MDFSELMGTLCPAGACNACGGCSTQLRKYVENADAYKNDPAIKKSEYSPSKVPIEISTVLYESWEAAYWTGGKISKPTVITYHFSDEHADFHGNVAGVTYTSTGNSYAWNEQWKEAIRLAASVHNAATGIMLIEVDDPTKADITWRIEEMLEVSGLGLVMAPGPTAFNGDIWINAKYIDQLQKMDLMPGGQGFEFAIHEFGHAIGMNHLYAGRYVLPNVAFDRSVSIMTHQEDPTGLMHSLSAIDIGALSYIYGTNAQKEAAPVQWEQLSGGGLKSVGSDDGNTIVGIGGKDWEVGGRGNDKLNGGEGDDFLDPGLGTDIVLGGTGTDTLIVSVRMRHLMQNPENLIFRNNTMQNDDLSGKEGIFKNGSNTITFTGIEKIQFLDGILDLRDVTWNVFKEADFVERIVKIVTGSSADDAQLKYYAEALLLGGASEIQIASDVYKEYLGRFPQKGDFDFVYSIVRNSYKNLPESDVVEGLVRGLEKGLWTRDQLILRVANSAELLGDEGILAKPLADSSTLHHKEIQFGDLKAGVNNGSSASEVFVVDHGGVEIRGNAGHDQIFLAMTRPEKIDDMIKFSQASSQEKKSGSFYLGSEKVNFSSVEQIRFIDGSFNFSADSVAAQVTRVYLTAVGRVPTADEIEKIVNLISAGTETTQTLAQDLVRSAEFSAKYATIIGSTASEAVSLRGDFVTHIWQVALGRSPSASEMNQWLNILSNQGHSYTGYLIDFLASSSQGKANFAKVIDAGIWVPDHAGLEISRIFHGLVGRLPVDSELAPFVWKGVAGGVSYDVIANEILERLAPDLAGIQSTKEFVEAVSIKILGHNVDESIINFWAARIDSGDLGRGNLVLVLVDDPIQYGRWLGSSASSQDAITQKAVQIQIDSDAIRENEYGTFVGKLKWDQHSVGSLHYSVNDDRFEINTNGELALRKNISLDHENSPEISLVVSVRDDSFLSQSTKIVVRVLDVNEAPSALTLSGTSVRENDKGAVIGVLSGLDPDRGDELRYSVSDDRFEVVGGKLALKAGVALDFERQAAVPVSITATDKGGLTISRDFTVQVLDVDEEYVAPLPTKNLQPGITIAGFTLAENNTATSTISLSKIEALQRNNDGTIFLRIAGGENISINAEVKSIKVGDGEINYSGDSSPAKVMMMYEGLLGRSVEKSGLQFWNDHLNSDQDLSAIASGIMASDEFNSRLNASSNSEFVKYLYENVLDRQADEEGFNHHISSLNQGFSRENVASSFVISSEAIDRFEFNNPNGVWTTDTSARKISMLYDTIFDRGIDEEGLRTWKLALNGGENLEEIAKSLIASHEFESKNHGASNEEFLTTFYHNSFGRGVDEAGSFFWLEKINTGEVSLEKLAVDISMSIEHATQFERHPASDIFGL